MKECINCLYESVGREADNDLKIEFIESSNGITVAIGSISFPVCYKISGAEIGGGAHTTKTFEINSKNIIAAIDKLIKINKTKDLNCAFD